MDFVKKVDKLSFGIRGKWNFIHQPSIKLWRIGITNPESGFENFGRISSSLTFVTLTFPAFHTKLWPINMSTNAHLKNPIVAKDSL